MPDFRKTYSERLVRAYFVEKLGELLTQNTRYNQLFDDDLVRLRLLALSWRDLMDALDRCDARVTAERHARKLVHIR